MKINSTITKLLEKRGIISQEDIEEFLSLKPQKTYDPFLLLNMEAGVDLIISAIKNGEKICIYGDYDADGITATALMLDVLGAVTDNLGFYIPSRFDEGYGLNKEAICQIKEDGYSMIITVDCGSVSCEEVDYAKELGLIIMVTDHHTVGENRPKCIVINPRQPECAYPFKRLAGVGVAFKVAQGLAQKGLIPRTCLTKVLDLVAVGTIGDVMPLMDENRTLVKYGIRHMNMGIRPGLLELTKNILHNNGEITSDNISFGIVPHLNAAGRMEDASISVKLLQEKDEEAIARDVAKLIEHNDNRKATQNVAYVKCDAIVREHYINDEFLVVKAQGIHEGIAGIVAGKLKESYNRPAIIVTQSGEFLKGTGRSIEGVNIHDMLNKYSDVFERFGGHAGACGFTIAEEKLDALRENLNRDMREIKDSDDQREEDPKNYEIIIGLESATGELCQMVNMLEPFGNMNPKPMFKVEGALISNMRYMGDKNQHVRFWAKQGESGIQCVLFNHAEEYIELLEGGQCDLIGCVELQYWRGNKRIQFIVEKIEV